MLDVSGFRARWWRARGAARSSGAARWIVLSAVLFAVAASCGLLLRSAAVIPRYEVPAREGSSDQVPSRASAARATLAAAALADATDLLLRSSTPMARAGVALAKTNLKLARARVKSERGRAKSRRTVAKVMDATGVFADTPDSSAPLAPLDEAQLTSLHAFIGTLKQKKTKLARLVTAKRRAAVVAERMHAKQRMKAKKAWLRTGREGTRPPPSTTRSPDAHARTSPSASAHARSASSGSTASPPSTVGPSMSGTTSSTPDAR